MRNFSRFFPALAVLFLVVVVLTGCSSKGPELAPVEGVVTLDGTPLEGATVLFHPADGGKPATGTTDAQGKFTLTTQNLGEGAQVGMNNVSVSKEKKAESPANVEEGEIVDVNLETPPKYASPKLSGLSVDVQPGMPPVTLELKTGE